MAAAVTEVVQKITSKRKALACSAVQGGLALLEYLTRAALSTCGHPCYLAYALFDICSVSSPYT